MHHLDGAARETESHGPERSLTGPVGDLVQGGPVYMSISSSLNHIAILNGSGFTYSAYCITPCLPS